MSKLWARSTGMANKAIMKKAMHNKYLFVACERVKKEKENRQRKLTAMAYTQTWK